MARSGSGLSQADFTRGMLSAAERVHLMNTFGADGSISQVLGILGDGKEATIYACRAGPDTGVDIAVAKVYRPQKFRAFAEGSVYHDGQPVADKRRARAIKNKTRQGRLMQHHEWIEREWETVCRVFDAGANVPEPYAHSSDAILMEYLGDADGISPQLRQVRLERGAAERALGSVLRDVETLLRCDRVHGDLSAYNILYHEGRPVLIDFPQAIDTRRSPHGYDLLRRDVENTCRYFARQGVRTNPRAIAHQMWSAYRRGEL